MNGGTTKRNSFLIWKVLDRQIDQGHRPMHRCLIKTKHFCKAVRWGKFSPTNSAGSIGYLHRRQKGFEHHPQNSIPDRFQISLAEVNNKAFRGNYRGSFLWRWTRKRFFKQYTSNNNRRKVDKLFHVKIKKLCSSKDTIMRTKRQGTFTIQMSHKGFASKIHKELLQINLDKNKGSQIEQKWVKVLNTFFTKEYIQMSNKQVKKWAYLSVLTKKINQ